jgi:hypothetical protein
VKTFLEQFVVSLPQIKKKVVAQARLVFGSDGSGQKSSTAYRVVKQLPSNWIKVVSWLNRGVVHVVTHEPMFKEGMGFIVQPNDKHVLDLRVATIGVEDPRTVIVHLSEAKPAPFPAPGPHEDPFNPGLVPADYGFDLQVLDTA